MRTYIRARAHDKGAVKARHKNRAAFFAALCMLSKKIYLNIKAVAVFLPYVCSARRVSAPFFCLVYFGGGNASGGGA